MLDATQQELVGVRYRLLEPLGVGGMGQVYRAFDRLTEQYVALKKIVFSPGLDENRTVPLDVVDLQLALAREFRALSGLRHPNIVHVYDYGFADKHPYLVMELLENYRPITDAARSRAFQGRLELGLHMLQALAYLHRHDIIHRDLKPSNILVRGDQLKLLDFGLASSNKGEAITAGTLLYMAPEVLQGQPTSVRSDLYTVGVILYELFTGRHPAGSVSNFTPPVTISRLIERLIATAPHVTDADPRIIPIVSRLLSKNPDQRFESAAAVMAALNAISEAPLSMETIPIRESFLQAAPFVGRESELQQLTKTLQIKDEDCNSRPVWLIGGESGVGKSRLLDEVRTRALVQGWAVMRGQATSEGSGTYQLWRDILRWLCLRVKPSVWEASILKMAIPDIGRLLKQDIPDAPPLDPNAMQERFLEVFQALFQRQTGPILLILEDLHWIASPDLLLLKRLMVPASPPTAPLLIMASYRNDETPHLPDELPGATTLTMRPLTDDDIAALSESMLGQAGRQSDLVTLLQRETEGNVFFLIEFVRVLAEDAGALDRVGQRQLPAHVLSGGVRYIVRRRLARISPEDRPLLQVAAVAGRELNLELLGHLAVGRDLTGWLNRAAAVAVLEIVGLRWRFAHDKLREAVLAELDPYDARRLNRQVAAALYRQHGDDPHFAAALNYHWTQAGEVDQAARSAWFAGKQALATAAYQEAIGYFRDYLAWAERNPAISPYQRAEAEQQLAMAHYSRAETAAAHDHLQKALAYLAWPLPNSTSAFIRGGLNQALTQFVAPIRWLKRPFAPQLARPVLQLTANIDATLSQIEFIDGQRPAAGYHALHLANVAEQAHTQSELAIGYANLTLALGQFRQHWLTPYYVRRSRQAAHTCDQPAAAAYALNITAHYQLGVGDWAEAGQALEAALTITRQSGERRREHEVLANYSFMLGLMGEFDRSFDLRQQMFDSAMRTGDLQARGWGLSGMGEMALWRADFEAADRYLRERLALNQQFTTKADQATTSHAMLALLAWRMNDYLTMRTEIAAALEQMTDPNLHVHSFQGIASLTQVLLDIWEASADPLLAPKLLPREQVIAEVGRVLAIFDRYSRLYPVGRPWGTRAHGLAAWLHGNKRAAQRSWDRALADAILLRMPFDEAWIRYDIGRHLPESDPLRRTQIDRAEHLFAKLGAGLPHPRQRAATGSLPPQPKG